MNITFVKQTALRLTRAIRCGAISGAGALDSPRLRSDLLDPDPSPQKRWSHRLLDVSELGLEGCASAERPLQIAVSSAIARPKTAYLESTVYTIGSGLPHGSFVRIADGIAMSSPELLFAEMADCTSPAEHLALGYELCGRFSRNPKDWRNGTVKMEVPPVTSVEKIGAFLEKAKWVRGVDKARKTLESLADNAWSPAEAVVATMASLPTGELGYGIRCELNVRVNVSERLEEAAAKGSRVPDILFMGTKVGINYDGAVHLDLRSIAQAGIEMGANPGVAETQRQLEKAMREVRAQAVDDIRRNRELAAEDYVVFPVVKEDLYEEGGLDKVMLQVVDAIERTGHVDMGPQRMALSIPYFKNRRQEIIWSLLPGKKERKASGGMELRFSDDAPEVREFIIGI